MHTYMKAVARTTHSRLLPWVLIGATGCVFAGIGFGYSLRWALIIAGALLIVIGGWVPYVSIVGTFAVGAGFALISIWAVLIWAGVAILIGWGTPTLVKALERRLAS